MLAEFLLAELNVSRKHKREEELMFLKERPTDILIKRICEVIDKVEKPSFQLLGWQCVFHSQFEEVDEPLKGVLVHGIDS